MKQNIATNVHTDLLHEFVSEKNFFFAMKNNGIKTFLSLEFEDRKL